MLVSLFFPQGLSMYFEAISQIREDLVSGRVVKKWFAWLP